MPRYEFIEGSSSKFWFIELDGSSFTTTYGKIGTDGQTSVKDWDSEDKAKKEYDKLVSEKTKKGYKLVDGGGASAAAAAPAKAEAPKKPAASAKKSDLFEDEGDEEDEAPKKQPAAKAEPAKAAPKAEPAKAAAPAPAASGGGKRHFEFVEGSSSKFWEIEIEGTSVITTYGRIGTSGQNSVKDFDSDAKAKKEYDKLVAEKTKKGYEEK
jgi:predicted DNA-binding WGR domain protein